MANKRFFNIIAVKRDGTYVSTQIFTGDDGFDLANDKIAEWEDDDSYFSIELRRTKNKIVFAYVYDTATKRGVKL